MMHFTIANPRASHRIRREDDFVSEATKQLCRSFAIPTFGCSPNADDMLKRTYPRRQMPAFCHAEVLGADVRPEGDYRPGSVFTCRLGAMKELLFARNDKSHTQNRMHIYPCVM